MYSGETLKAQTRQKLLFLSSYASFLLYFLSPFSVELSSLFLLIASILFSLALGYPWHKWVVVSGLFLVAALQLYPGSPKLQFFIHGTLLLVLFTFVQHSRSRIFSGHEKSLRTLQILLRQSGNQSIDLTQEAALILNLRGVIDDAFPEACTLLGLSASALKGNLASPLLGIPPFTFPLPPSTQGEFTWNKNGVDITIKYRIRPILKQGVPCGALLILSDISEELRRSEAYLQAAKFSVIGQVSAGLAHELRNPITTVKGFMQLTPPEQWPPNIRPYHQLILDEISVTDRLLSHFLLLTNPSAPQFTLLDLKELAVSATQMLHANALIAEVTFRFAWPDSGPHIMGDPDQLLHAFLSVLQNAIEASPQRETILLTARTIQETVDITVEDSGPGIPESLRERVFDPFFTTRKEGTGLGLTIAQQIMLAHHGTLRITGTPSGKGTCVTLSFPATDSSPRQML